MSDRIDYRPHGAEERAAILAGEFTLHHQSDQYTPTPQTGRRLGRVALVQLDYAHRTGGLILTNNGRALGHFERYFDSWLFFNRHGGSNSAANRRMPGWYHARLGRSCQSANVRQHCLTVLLAPLSRSSRFPAT